MFRAYWNSKPVRSMRVATAACLTVPLAANAMFTAVSLSLIDKALGDIDESND